MKRLLFLVMGVLLSFQLHANPTYVTGNPDCSDLGLGTSEYKVEPVADGTYSLDGINSVTLSNVDGHYIDWSSTLPLDAVIVKGGPSANVWIYDPEATSGSGLYSPMNGDQPYGLSHVSFCYDYEVTVSKSAETSYYRTYDWDIQKSVDPTSLTLEVGESADVSYNVVVNNTGYTDSGWSAAGAVEIYNPAPMAALIDSVVDNMDGLEISLNCDVDFPFSLASGETLTCTYAADLPDGTNRTNIATVATTGPVLGGTASAAVDFGSATVTEIDECVEITDPMGGGVLGTVCTDSAPQTYPYSYTVGPYDVCGPRDVMNTATLTALDSGGTQSDTETVSVDVICRLDISKNANTAYTHTCDWNIDKSADAENLTLAVGQQYQVNYAVDVSMDCLDSDWDARGSITIHNPAPAPIDATLVSVTDVMDGVEAEVNCSVLFPYTLVAGSTLTCQYAADLPDGTNRTNIATVATTGPVLGGTASAAVDFGSATVTEIDECVDVTDTMVGMLSPPEMLCEDDTPKFYLYSRYVGPYAECDTDYRVDNTAGLLTNDTSALREDSWTVYITIPPCGYGCTLTPGYWKTHSEHGPAPYDNTWALLLDGADTTFYLSGQSFHEVLWMPPEKGNAYYILAHAYIAAYMNDRNGAEMTAVLAEMARAEELFSTYTPDISKKVGKEFKAIASILDDFNNGLVGPGHCDTDVQSIR